jgi:hypothetical protein
MAVVEGTIFAVEGTVDAALDLMGDWGTAFALSTGVVAAFTEVVLLIKNGLSALSGAATAIISLMIVTISTIFTTGWIVYLLDVCALVLAELSMYDMFFNADELGKSVIAPLVSAFGKAVAICAIVGAPLQIINHGLSGAYSS